MEEDHTQEYNAAIQDLLSVVTSPSFFLFKIKCPLYLICSFKRRANTEARDINKNIHGISVTQNNIVRRKSQDNNINYNPYFVAEDDFQVLRSFHFSDVGHEGRNQYSKLIA